MSGLGGGETPTQILCSNGNELSCAFDLRVRSKTLEAVHATLQQFKADKPRQEPILWLLTINSRSDPYQGCFRELERLEAVRKPRKHYVSGASVIAEG